MSVSTKTGFAIERLGHAVLRVRDIDRSEAFYRDVLGLQVRRRVGDRAVFFTLGEQDHDLAVMSVGADAPPPEETRVGLYHLAFRLADAEALRAAYHHFLEHGVQIAGVNHHRVSKSVYIKDPDGIEIEIYCDVDAEGPDGKGSEATLREELAGR